MRLVVPHIGELQGADARLVDLGEFLGIDCQRVALRRNSADPMQSIEKLGDSNACFVVSPPVIKQWLPMPAFPVELGRCLISRFPCLLVHNLHPDPFTDSVLRTFSGCIDSVRPVEDKGYSYDISRANHEVTGPFTGLRFGPVHPATDRVFEVRNNDPSITPLISIGSRPFLASVRTGSCRLFFLGCGGVADLNADVEGARLTDYFSQLLPPAMVLRYLFREECWVPNRPHGTLIIDDPLLRRNYGFLNFDRLLPLMDQHNFHTTIAFIPHNFRRDSSTIVRMFRERPDRFSICYHGNDHTGAEFAEKDLGRLNVIISIAKARMKMHAKQTGIECNGVMIFPQGKFSSAAMTALKTHNFAAAVNSGPHALGDPKRLLLSQVAQPAVLKFDGFPLFLRQYVKQIQPEDIAFNVFFGRPILIVEHHEIFKDPESLIELVSRINRMIPEMRWSDLQTAVTHSYLTRKGVGGDLHLRAYANCGSLENQTGAPVRVFVEWNHSGNYPIEKVIINHTDAAFEHCGKANIAASFDLVPNEVKQFALHFRSQLSSAQNNLGLAWAVKAFARRRLSEFRDNCLSKNPAILSAAKSLQRRFLSSDPN